MVRKDPQKAIPSASSSKKPATKVTVQKPLRNGHIDGEVDFAKENTDIKMAAKKGAKKGSKKGSVTETPAEIVVAEQAPTDIVIDKEADTEIVIKEASGRVKGSKPSGSKVTGKASKRKTPTGAEKVKKEVKATTSTKRQKFALEVPTIHSVSGKVFVIGDNATGQLGLGEDVTEKKTPAPLELPSSVVDIAAGGMHSVCLTEGGEVFTFGCNDEGALGRVTEEDGSEYEPGKVEIPERIVQVSAGDSHSAALSDSGHVYLWGNFKRGDGSMGLVTDGAKQTLPVRILNNVTVVKIASGSDHFVCLSNEGAVYTCGCAEMGQLGRVSRTYTKDGGRRGMASLLTPDKVPVGNAGVLVNNIWTTLYGTFLSMQDSGAIYAFGLNNYSQLGFESQVDFHGEPEPILKPKKVASFSQRAWSQITGGQHHTIALDNSGLVYALGRPEYGRLGLGDNNNLIVSVPTMIPTLEDRTCIDISCGDVTSFAVSDNGAAFSWGMGTNYQLGHGNDEDGITPRQIEGTFSKSWKALKIAGGGQHTLILATARKSQDA